MELVRDLPRNPPSGHSFHFPRIPTKYLSSHTLPAPGMVAMGAYNGVERARFVEATAAFATFDVRDPVHGLGRTVGRRRVGSPVEIHGWVYWWREVP